MMKIITALLFILLNNDCSTLPAATGASEEKETVYVCGSGNGKRYHLKENCRGLNNCSAKTVKTTVEKAKKEGKTLCGWEK